MAVINSASSSKSGSLLRTFDFLALAAEVRCKIYRPLLVLDRPIDEDADGVCCLQASARMRNTTRPDVGILACCKLIRAEALPYLYAHNTFRVSMDGGRLRAFHRFASPEKCSLIRSIILYNDCWGISSQPLMNFTRVAELKQMPSLSKVVLRWELNRAMHQMDPVAQMNLKPGRLCEGIKMLKKTRPDVSCMLLIEEITPPVVSFPFAFKKCNQTLFRLSVNDETVTLHKVRQVECKDEADMSLGYTVA